VGDAIDNLRHRNSYQVDEIDRDKARELYDHYFGTAHAKQEMQRVSQGLRSDAEIQRAIKEYDAIMADDAQQLVDMGLTPPHKMSQMEYDAFFPGWGTKPTVEAPKTPLQTKPDWRDLGKWGVATGLGTGVMGSGNVEAAGVPPGLLRRIKELDNWIARETGNFNARHADSPGTSRVKKQEWDRIQEKMDERARLQKELEGADQNPVWGPTPGAMRIQEMMDRYGDVKGGMGTDPRQMELRLDMPRLGPLQELDASIRRDTLPQKKKAWAEQTEMDAAKKRLENFDINDWRKQKDWINETTTIEERRKLMEAQKRREMIEKARALRGDFDDAYGDPDSWERSLDWD
jgi:hypothetical protein